MFILTQRHHKHPLPHFRYKSLLPTSTTTRGAEPMNSHEQDISECSLSLDLEFSFANWKALPPQEIIRAGSVSSLHRATVYKPLCLCPSLTFPARLHQYPGHLQQCCKIRLINPDYSESFALKCKHFPWPGKPSFLCDVKEPQDTEQKGLFLIAHSIFF